jgi:hypothetical protein
MKKEDRQEIITEILETVHMKKEKLICLTASQMVM